MRDSLFFARGFVNNRNCFEGYSTWNELRSCLCVCFFLLLRLNASQWSGSILNRETKFKLSHWRRRRNRAHIPNRFNCVTLKWKYSSPCAEIIHLFMINVETMPTEKDRWSARKTERGREDEKHTHSDGERNKRTNSEWIANIDLVDWSRVSCRKNEAICLHSICHSFNETIHSFKLIK